MMVFCEFKASLVVCIASSGTAEETCLKQTKRTSAKTEFKCSLEAAVVSAFDTLNSMCLLIVGPCGIRSTMTID